MLNNAMFNYVLFWAGTLTGIAGTITNSTLLAVLGGGAVGWSTYRLYFMARYPEVR